MINVIFGVFLIVINLFAISIHYDKFVKQTVKEFPWGAVWSGIGIMAGISLIILVALRG